MTSLNERWATLGRAGLLSVGLPSRFGGQGGGPAEVWRSARRVGNRSGDLGVGLSWAVHHIVSRFQVGLYGTDEQKAAWLPRLAAGESIAATAIEDDGTSLADGSVRTTATRDEFMYALEGVKTAVINAPAAELLVVGACTPTSDDPDAISAFLVHRDTPGVHFEPAPDRRFCPTSPLANVVLHDCRVPLESLLGEPGAGRAMLDQVGEQYDVLLLQVICGYLTQLLDQVAPLLRGSDAARLTRLVLRGRQLALQSLNTTIANQWDARDDDPVGFAAAQAAARELVERTRDDIAALPEHPAVAAAERDLQLISLSWSLTRKRFLAAVRADEQAARAAETAEAAEAAEAARISMVSDDADLP